MSEVVTLAHNVDLPFAAGKAPPSEFRIFAAGKIETTKGTFLFDAKAADLVMASARAWGNEYPIDYDHAMGSFFALDPAESGKAAGWFKPELRNGELWATNVSWTPKATEKLTAREYRYHSPAFRIEEEDKRISELVNVGLTNLPATKNHPPLMASRAGEPGKESKMKTIAVALSLAAEATEAEVLAAVSALQSFAARVLSDVGAKTHAEALGILAGWKGNADQVAVLSRKVDEYRAKEVAAEIETMIAEGKTAGKITPSSEPAVRQLAKDHGPAALRGFLAAAQAAPKPIGDPATGSVDDLTPQELSALSGRDEKYIARIREEKKRAIKAGVYPGAV